MIGVLHHASFRAMGTSCTLSVTATDADRRHARRALDAGRAEVEACESALSRFDPASDLSRLNSAAGAWVDVDPRLAGRASTRAPRAGGDGREVRSNDPSRARRRRLRPDASSELEERPALDCARLAGCGGDRGGGRRRVASGSRAEPRSTSAVSARASRRRVCSARCATPGTDPGRDRRSRRRRRRLGPAARPRPVADRDRRPAATRGAAGRPPTSRRAASPRRAGTRAASAPAGRSTI